MALSGLDIYKLLPKTNCRACGFATCLAFAMAIAKKATTIDKCPYLSEEAKKVLEASSLPPIQLVTMGEGENKLEVGNETVMFRHEEKFHHPCGIGIIIEDSLPEAKIIEQLKKINALHFERVGQLLSLDLVAVKQCSNKEKFVNSVKLALTNTKLNLVLMSDDHACLRSALELCKPKKPLIYAVKKENLSVLSALAKEFCASLVVCAQELDGLSELTSELSKQGITQLILDTGQKPITERIWDLTQARRQALKKSNRLLGYPMLTIINAKDPFDEVIEAATYITKYSGIILLKGMQEWQVLSLLTLRQNIYTDPQKPLQIEPKLYPVGQADSKSPVLVTTNFSLSYYTVLAEVEASKVPAYILSVDTEGMSVLTAWAAEKFNAEKVSDSLKKLDISQVVSHKKLIIPGYVAVMSGDLEETSGWQVLVGPKEAAGIPAFLKNL